MGTSSGGHERLDTAKLFLTYKDVLFAIAYRMLGSATDAEDIVQDTFSDLQQTELNPKIIDTKAYLCKIVYNKCKDHLRKEIRARQAYVGPWLPEPLLTDHPDERYLAVESLSTAYLLLLQQLSEAERTVFILREVGQFQYSEIAYVIDKTESNCRQIYHRANRALKKQEHTSNLDSHQIKPLIEQFVHALQNGDLEQLVEVLSDDVVFTADSGGKVTGSLVPIRTSERVAKFLMNTSGMLPEGMETHYRQINNQWGLVLSEGANILYVFTFRFQQECIQAIDVIANPEKLTYIKRQRDMESKV